MAWQKGTPMGKIRKKKKPVEQRVSNLNRTRKEIKFRRRMETEGFKFDENDPLAQEFLKEIRAGGHYIAPPEDRAKIADLEARKKWWAQRKAGQKKLSEKRRQEELARLIRIQKMDMFSQKVGRKLREDEVGRYVAHKGVLQTIIRKKIAKPTNTP